jgi:tRNA pseudouridine32 synthase/23S rRNA pseudouridine746 synthase
MTADQILARVLYRDAMMLVLDKPPGLAVHAGPRGGPSLEDLFDALRYGLPRPPSLAHRLDRDTSGCLVLGRHRKALALLGELFSSGRVEKVYWAVVEGAPLQDHGTIDLALTKRSTRAKGWWMEPDPAGQRAITEYRVAGRAAGRAWVELRPKTGRTHQIRAHLEAIGCPVVGDPVYGADGAGSKLARLHLHSRSIAIPLYPKRSPIHVEASPPPHMHAMLRACGAICVDAVTER